MRAPRRRINIGVQAGNITNMAVSKHRDESSRHGERFNPWRKAVSPRVQAFALLQPAMLALLRSPISRISRNLLKTSVYLVQARVHFPARPLPPRSVVSLSTTPARRAEEDPLSPSIIALSQSPLVQKLANNPEAMEAFRAFLKVIVDEGAFLFPPLSLTSAIILYWSMI